MGGIRKVKEREEWEMGGEGDRMGRRRKEGDGKAWRVRWRWRRIWEGVEDEGGG